MTPDAERERVAARMDALFERAREWHRTATPEAKEAMWQAQRESWKRAFTTPCEHGVLDFEECGRCRCPAPSQGDDPEVAG